MGERPVRLELDRLAHGESGPVELARAEERVAEVEVGARVGGVDLDRLAQVRDRRRNVTLLEGDEPLAREAGREAPRGRGDALEVARGARGVAEVPVAVCAVVEDLHEHFAPGEVAEVEPLVQVRLLELVALHVVPVGEARALERRLDVDAEAAAVVPAHEEVAREGDAEDRQPGARSQREVEDGEPEAVPAPAREDAVEVEVGQAEARVRRVLGPVAALLEDEVVRRGEPREGRGAGDREALAKGRGEPVHLLERPREVEPRVVLARYEERPAREVDLRLGRLEHALDRDDPDLAHGEPGTRPDEPAREPGEPLHVLGRVEGARERAPAERLVLRDGSALIAQRARDPEARFPPVSHPTPRSLIRASSPAPSGAYLGGGGVSFGSSGDSPFLIPPCGISMCWCAWSSVPRILSRFTFHQAFQR